MSAPTDHDLPPLNATPTGLYRHYKGGWYEVLDTVRCSETLQGMTLYRALYGGRAAMEEVMLQHDGRAGTLLRGRDEPRLAIPRLH